MTQRKIPYGEHQTVKYRKKNVFFLFNLDGYEMKSHLKMITKYVLNIVIKIGNLNKYLKKFNLIRIFFLKAKFTEIK